MPTPEQILLSTFALINISTLISRSVMQSVGNNDGRDCPNVGGPAVACVAYGISMLILIGLTIKAKMDGQLNNVKLGLFVLLILCNIGIFVSYIPFAIKASKKSDTDTECLTSENKKAIEVMEMMMNGVLVVLTPIMLFMN